MTTTASVVPEERTSGRGDFGPGGVSPVDDSEGRRVYHRAETGGGLCHKDDVSITIISTSDGRNGGSPCCYKRCEAWPATQRVYARLSGLEQKISSNVPCVPNAM